MRRLLRWRVLTIMAIVAVVAVLVGGYRAATTRRTHYELAAVNYEIWNQRLAMKILLDRTNKGLSGWPESETSDDPEIRELERTHDLHERQAELYRQAARSPVAWMRVHPVPRLCDCAFCDSIERRDAIPRNAVP